MQIKDLIAHEPSLFVEGTQILTSEGFCHLSSFESGCVLVPDFDKNKLIPKSAVVQADYIVDHPLIIYNSKKVNLRSLSGTYVYAKKITSDDYEFLCLDSIPNASRLYPALLGIYSNDYITDFYSLLEKVKDVSTRGIFPSKSFAFGFVIGFLLCRAYRNNLELICKISHLEILLLLTNALNSLEIYYHTDIETSQYSNGYNYVCKIPYTEEILEYILVYEKTNKDNRFLIDYSDLTRDELLGLYFGISFAGSRPIDGRMIQYLYSSNLDIIMLFQYIAFVFGYDCHLNKRPTKSHTNVCVLNLNRKLSLRLIKKDRQIINYTGKVYKVIVDADLAYFRNSHFDFSYLCPI